MELFSDAWMQKFMEEWNKEPELSGALEKIGFNSTIAYGFPEDDQPRGVINIENGKATAAGNYQGESVNWDLRANEKNWQNWMEQDISMMGLGVAYTTRKLKFMEGDYAAMIKDPRMAAPFIKSFNVMSRIK